jgi:hypothetical protein
MPYLSGETPALGDQISDSSRRVGTVTHILYYGEIPELVVKWNDGTIGIRYRVHDDFVLIERAATETISIS